MNLVSIIIPIYNAQSFLSKCIDSILKQTYKNYELILVNDASIDNSKSICEFYLKKDSRILYIENAINIGVSATRNKGLKIAKGEYITFCDNDDIVSPNWLQHLVNSILHNNNILPICAISENINILGNRKNTLIPHQKILNKEKYYSFNQIGIAGYIWNTIYRKKIIDQYNIHFRSRRDIGDINEDLIFSLDYLKHIDYILYTGYADYYHTKNNTNHSSTTDDKFYYDKYLEKYHLWKTFISSYKYENKKNDLQLLANHTLYHFIHALKTSSLKGIKKIHFYKKVICSKEMIDLLQYADLTKENKKLIYLLKKKHYTIVWTLFHIYK